MQLERIVPDQPHTPRSTPLVFVHGAWHGAWCWQVHFIPYFIQAGFPVYALSVRGHGRSEGRTALRWTRIADFVQDLATLAAHLTPPPILIGHSMGGLIVQKYLEQYAASAGVLLAPVPPSGAMAAALRIARRQPRAFLKANATLRLYPLVETPALAQELLFSASMPAEQAMQYAQQLQDESYRAFLDMLGFNLPKPKRVAVPMCVIGAAHDAIFSPSEVEATARAHHTTATIFPDMAHDMMLETGWQAVADTILAWLGKHGF